MLPFHSKSSVRFPRVLLIFAILSTLFLFPVGKRFLINHQFEQYTNRIFFTEVASNQLNLHYTLAHPQNYNISIPQCTLGTLTFQENDTYRLLCENRKYQLLSFPYQSLTKENQIAWDSLYLYYSTELLPGNNPALDEVLSPSLGVQAQLPVLLAEYTFRCEEDIQNYLELLSSVPEYFNSILNFQFFKTQQGTFMSDVTLHRIIEQCSTLLEETDQFFLITAFQEKLNEISYLTDTQKKAYQTLHQKIIQQDFLPSYQRLIDGLLALEGNGKNPGGLCHLEGGKSYYEYLIKQKCGIYDSIPELQAQLLEQLQQDLKESESLLKEHPSLIEEYVELCEDFRMDASPEEYLLTLQERMKEDFPSLPTTTYQVKEVPDSLAPHLSPAFYLTPPVDTLTPNIIYINTLHPSSYMDLFTTLGHEGFPGHLYQTVYFASTSPPLIRHILNSSGYIEGWATYVESYAYSYLDLDPALSRFAWLNRSTNLCIFSLLDIGIHYHGWSLKEAGEFLASFQITDQKVQQEIYQIIVEDPANYLKYYGGCIKFMELDTYYKDKKDFHKQVLSIGPCPFPVLEKHLDLSIYQ